MHTNYLKLMTLASLFAFSLAGCEKDTETVTVNNPVYNIRGNASGKQEVPANTSTATGTLTGTYDKDKNLVTYTVNWTGLTGGNPTAAHFHGAAEPGGGVRAQRVCARPAAVGILRPAADGPADRDRDRGARGGDQRLGAAGGRGGS